MTVYQDSSVQLIQGDALDVLKTLPDEYVNCVVTSPPYWGLRDYNVDGQIGLEPTPEAYIHKMMAVFREVRRVLKDDGTLWLNLGDSYAGSGKGIGSDNGKAVFTDGEVAKTNWKMSGLKPKDLVGIPWRVAFALQADGWYLRSDIIWAKPNPMPESVTDRPTKAHEYLFLLSKRERYYYDQEAIQEQASEYTGRAATFDRTGNPVADHIIPNQSAAQHRARPDKQRGHGRRHDGFNDRLDAMEKADQCSGMRNKRTVWTVATQPYAEAHFATFPEALIEPCILAGAPAGGLVLDPFSGAATTLLVAKKLNRRGVGIELNPDYCAMSAKRLSIEPSRLL